MKAAHTILVTVITAVIAVMTTLWIAPRGTGSAPPPRETAYERVLRTGEIRCGYGVFPPYLSKDAKTGAFGGIWYDLTEEVGKQLGLKIVWAEEVGTGDTGAALNYNRIDMYCAGLWPASSRVRAMNFLHPASFDPMLVYVRVDDHRFDNDLSRVNSPDVAISAMDGEGASLIAVEDFPKAKIVSVPQLSSYADMFNNVAMRKADIVVAAPPGAADYIKNNPGKLRPLSDKPLRVFPVSLAVKYGENELRDMLNQAQDNVLYNGTMDKILARYEINKGDFWRVSKPYRRGE